MFESDSVLWLQSFASEWLTSLLVFITELRRTRAFVAFVLVILFGVNVRLGLIIFQMML